MKTITVRLEDPTHKRIKKQLIDDETTFQEYVMSLINMDLVRRDKEV